MAEMIFEWKHHRFCNGVDAQAAGEALERIREEEGAIAPAVVVQRAKGAAHPLHPCFEWDDATAAYEHRLHQARGVVKSLVVVRKDGPFKEKTTLYFNVKKEEEREGHYQRFDVVRDRPDEWKLVLADFRQRLQSAQRSVAELESLSYRSCPETTAKVLEITKQLDSALEMAGSL